MHPAAVAPAAHTFAAVTVILPLEPPVMLQESGLWKAPGLLRAPEGAAAARVRLCSTHALGGPGEAWPMEKMHAPEGTAAAWVRLCSTHALGGPGEAWPMEKMRALEGTAAAA